ncbi:hypothetical protein L1987_54363 [Smallanthus sonchifolius]|uniref:Uncharacterized protein n=1 Tax=Smallanthus sonchifolius TaxID=185202 RepID=A0ACB9E710_9ASTR|nr:hypothetical protein L1987_54363 [Smallanthus sonchifolius]
MASSSRTSQIDRFCKRNLTIHLLFLKSQMEELPPKTTQDVAFWSEVCSFCDSISSSDRSFNQIPALRSPSFRAEYPNTFMFWDNHNPWEDELSEDSNYTPFEFEFSQDEINAIQINK